MRKLAFALGFFSILLSVEQARAASLILVERSASSNAAYGDFSSKLYSLIATNHLKTQYANIDVLAEAQATPAAVTAQIRARVGEGSVDLFVLAPASAAGIALSGGVLDSAAIGALKKLLHGTAADGSAQGLRLVYLSGSDTSSLTTAFRAVGARAVVARSGAEVLPEVFFARFVRRWSEGAGVQESAASAAQAASDSIRAVAPYLAKTAANPSQLVVKGSDIEISGAVASRGEESSELPLRTGSQNAAKYEHADFEEIGIRMAGGILPGAEIDPARVPDAGTLISDVKDSAWAHLGDVFGNTNPGDGIPQGGDAPYPGKIWIDGSSVKFLMGSLATWGDGGGGIATQALDSLTGIELERDQNDLSISAYFTQELSVQLKEKSEAKNFAVYAIHVPKTLQFKISADNGVLTTSSLDDGLGAHSKDLFVKVKIPILPDNVYLRAISIDLASGGVKIDAGVIGDFLTLLAEAQLRAKTFKVDIWDTVQSNLSLFTWPDFVFAGF